jgi:phage terminase large subunit
MSYQLTTSTRKIAKLSKPIRAIQGGTSASKTISILLLLIQAAQKDNKPSLTSVVSESVPHLKRGTIRDFKNILQAHKYWNDKRWNATDFIYTFETGSQIEFFSADNGDKLRGGRRDRLFINECNNVTLDAFNQLESRTRDFTFLDWNPSNEFWFYTDVLGQSDDVDHIIVTYKDNESLTPNEVRKIERRKSNKNWWLVYGLGQLGELESRIYTGWNLIDEIPENARLEKYGLDFGYTNDPTAIVALWYYDDSYILDQITFQKGLSNKEIADILKGKDRALVIADSAEPKSIDEIKGYHIPITPSKKGPGSVLQGIQFVQEQTISITKRSVDVIKEYRNYVWMTDKNGKIINEPDHAFSHSMDAIRYGFSQKKRTAKLTFLEDNEDDDE